MKPSERIGQLIRATLREMGVENQPVPQLTMLAISLGATQSFLDEFIGELPDTWAQPVLCPRCSAQLPVRTFQRQFGFDNAMMARIRANPSDAPFCLRCVEEDDKPCS